jgi:hypothetical protein
MLRLSDSELDQVYAACRPLAPDRRDAFLQALAAELRDKPIGPGSVHRAIVLGRVLINAQKNNYGHVA